MRNASKRNVYEEVPEIRDMEEYPQFELAW
ncbi:hypothetical protein J2Y45_001780 [Dyadobacter sp. BE34]|nr:hypothetical protein [Dyadobacter sp. BE34]